MNNSQKIYEELIKRIKDNINNEKLIFYDPDTGIERCYLKGKLLWARQIDKKSRQ